jgi:predicted ATPase
MALVTLLGQPYSSLPSLIVLDEPELGLHPYALEILASLFKRVAGHSQIIASTQSAAFLDSFDAEDIIVVDRENNSSTFTRHDKASLAEWLEDYSLGELWRKNLVGGRP